MSELTTIEQQSLQDLSAQLGAGGQGSSNIIMPELKINYDEDDDNGNELKLGDIFVKEDKNDKNFFYAKTVSFRPISQMHQYSIYNTNEQKITCKSRLIADFFEEARDTQGTLRCGKPTSKEMRDIPEEDRKKYSDIKNQRQLRGLVSFTGKNALGEEKTYENYPVLIRLNGQNNYQVDKTTDKIFAPFEQQYLKKVPRGSSMWNFNVNITTEKRKNALKKSYFTYEYAPDFKNQLPMEKDLYDTIMMIKEIIDGENNYVDGRYYKALKGETYDAEAAATLDELHESLDADYEEVA
jgi:hypothetical protein